ncbi:MAG: serine carboxypeptidase [Chloroflexaceae bacterium]|nr:serine carboxypeptidase [Chloroflexaceae bacterium]
MKHVLVIHDDSGDETATIQMLGTPVQVRRIGCGGDLELARRLIAEHDGQVSAIALENMPASLRLGPARQPHALGSALAAAARQTPVVDGSGVRPMLERWGVILADRAQPGIFSRKRVLMVPGLNHDGLAHALSRRGCTVRYADPVVFFGMPDLPGVGSPATLPRVAAPTLEWLKTAPFHRVVPRPGTPRNPRPAAPFAWADLLAGEIGAIRRYAPPSLQRKTIVVEWASAEDRADLQARGASIVVSLLDGLIPVDGLRHWSAATVEGLLAALRANPDAPLTEDTYLDLLAEIDWSPAITYLQPEDAGINKFAFVIHPLNVSFIHSHPWFGWTRYLPDELVEAVAAYFPPIYVGKVSGARSVATGQRVEGYLISLGATPRQMMRHGERFTYTRLNQAARMAERMGARIMGLGAFTSVVGDAGATVAHEADIAITSGNSLTVAATLEAAKQAVRKMGASDLTQGRAMVIGATGSIGSVCSRLLAQAIRDVVLVSIEPEKLIALKRTIEEETPGARVIIATRSDELAGECDLIVTATSAFGQRVLDITRCKPGAVICDVARPPDISEAEAALRPDVLVIESGEVLLPGDVSISYNIGLPPGTVYACLAETALLAMDGRFEDYTIGRNITMERVKEIYRLFKKHGLQLAGLRSLGVYVTDEDVQAKRALADRLRADPALFARTRAEAAERLARIPAASKGVRARRPARMRWAWAAVGVALAGIGLRRRLARSTATTAAYEEVTP